MHIFTDNKGRKWDIVLNVNQMKRVRAVLGIDLVNVITLDAKGEVKVDLISEPKLIETASETFLSRTVVLATGANPRELGVEKESELVGRGVAYCAACDGIDINGLLLKRFLYASTLTFLKEAD